MPKVFLATAFGGELVWDQPNAVVPLLHRANGKRLRVTVERYDRRSLDQNRMQWGTYRRGVQGMVEYTGHSEKEIHEFLKDEFCPEVEIRVGKVAKRVKSTALLTREQSSAYIEACLAWFAQQGVTV